MHRLLVVLLALVVAPTASAFFSVTLNTGNVIAPGVTLTGVDQTTTFTIQITVVQSATTGWNVSATATLPTVAGRTLPALAVTNVTRAACTPSGCSNPANNVTWPVALSTGGTKIYNATANSGQGSVVITPTVQITYPANALPGTYVSTLTVSGVGTGP
jgi:hypothetical protein